MSLAARLGRALFWGQAARLVEAVLLFFFSLLLARVLGPESYGLYALGVSLAGACGFVVLLGLGPETLGWFLPELAATGETGRARWLLGLLLAVRGAAIFVLAVAVFLMREKLARPLGFPSALLPVALVLSLFAARSVLDLFTYFSSGLLELRRVALAKLAASLAAPCAFLLTLAFGHAGARGAWLAAIAGSLAGIAVLALPLLSGFSRPGGEGALPLRRVLAFGMFAWATQFFVFILGDNTDVLLLGWLVHDRAAIGRYAVGAKIVFSSAGLLLGWASLASVATFSEALQRRGVEGLARAVEAQWKLGVLCVAAPFLLLIRYAREILALLYSSAYAPSASIAETLAALVGCGVLLGFTLGTSALYAAGRERLACALVAASAAFNIVSEIVLVRRMGTLGAALSTGVSFVLLAALSTAASRLCIPWRFPSAFIVRVAAAALLAVVPTFWLAARSVASLLFAAGVWSIALLASLALLKPLAGGESAALGGIHPRLAALAGIFSSRPQPSALGVTTWQS